MWSDSPIDENRSVLARLWRKRLYRPEALGLMVKDLLRFRGPVHENQVHLVEAAEWLLRAHRATPDGGVSGGYSFEDGWIASYPETTGYIIPTLIDYAEFSRNPVYHEAALQMSEWELSCQLESGAFPGHFVDRDNPPVVFNTGQVIFGLLAAYQVTSDIRFMAAAQRAGRWLAQIQDVDGAFRQFDYCGEVHSYNTRTAWAMAELGLATNDDIMLKASSRHLDWAASEQLENGWFRFASFSSNQDPFLHTIAYAAQGLFEAGVSLGQQDYINAALQTARAVAAKVRKDGSIAGTFNQSWNSTVRYSCLTGNAQMAILWFRAYQVAGDSGLRDCAHRALRFLKSVQDCVTPNLKIRGAIKGSYPISGRYLFGTFPNWATKFFMDALMLEESVSRGLPTKVRCW